MSDIPAPGLQGPGSLKDNRIGRMTPRTRQFFELVLDNLVWFMLIFVLAVFSALVPNYFQLGIFANIIEASSVLGVMSIGLALVIIAGHMDLSVESVAALSAMAVGILFCSAGIGMGFTLSPEWLMVPVSLLIALAVGGLIGLLNGFLIVKVKMNAFIITLASYIWVRGIVLAVSGGRTPTRFFEALSQRPLDWSRIDVTLVDEASGRGGWLPCARTTAEAGLRERSVTISKPAPVATTSSTRPARTRSRSSATSASRSWR